jgi:hypothetical protein
MMMMKMMMIMMIAISSGMIMKFRRPKRRAAGRLAHSRAARASKRKLHINLSAGPLPGHQLHSAVAAAGRAFRRRRRTRGETLSPHPNPGWPSRVGARTAQTALCARRKLQLGPKSRPRFPEAKLSSSLIMRKPVRDTLTGLRNCSPRHQHTHLCTHERAAYKILSFGAAAATCLKSHDARRRLEPDQNPIIAHNNKTNAY